MNITLKNKKVYHSDALASKNENSIIEENEGVKVIENRPKKRGKRHPNKIKEPLIDKIIHGISLSCLIIFVIIILFPLLNYFSLAFNNYAYNDKIVIWPSKWDFSALKYVFSSNSKDFWRAFLNSVIITLTVTIVSNLVEAMAAYPLSKKNCPFRSGILMFFIITMLFSAGVVPIYLLMRSFNLLNTIWSIILISISNVTNLLFFKTFFENIPSEVQEAAIIDGASPLQMFFRIIVPMALPVFGSCCFFTIVGMWNGYGAALIFINSEATEAMPLAYYLYISLTNGSAATMYDDFLRNYQTNIQAASMLISIIPILIIYPYVIKYIKSGATLGSVKG